MDLIHRKDVFHPSGAGPEHNIGRGLEEARTEAQANMDSIGSAGCEALRCLICADMGAEAKGIWNGMPGFVPARRESVLDEKEDIVESYRSKPWRRFPVRLQKTPSCR